MTLWHIVIPLLIYILPILFFIYMGIDVLVRNTGKTEHQLVSLISGCYALLFLEEFVRYFLPISYSPFLVAAWFGNAGAMIPSLGLHFIAKLLRIEKKMPRFVYPYIFYVPLLAVAATIAGQHNIFNSTRFIESGIWKLPVFNPPYYMAMTVGNLFSLSYIFLLARGKHNAADPGKKQMYNYLIAAGVWVLLWDMVFGYINFGRMLPPYPYIYGGLAWIFFLRLAMIKYDFLSFSHKRYEVLFNLNPLAILLIDEAGRIKEANPSAMQMFNHHDLTRISFFERMEDGFRDSWILSFRQLSEARSKMTDLEGAVFNQDQKIEVSVDCEFVQVEQEHHAILILRDITREKKNQQAISFLAYHDSLTQLPNRRYFYEQIERALDSSRKEQQMLGIIVIDMDFFKEINDEYGHNAGDRFLQHAAGIVEKCVQQRGVAARVGGDEFYIFLQDLKSELALRTFAEQLSNSLSGNPFEFGGQMIEVQFSIGASLFPEDGDQVDALIHQADHKMYAQKRKRHRRWAK